MVNKIVFGIENIDISQWSGLIAAGSAGNAFQTPQMYKVFEATENYEPEVAGTLDAAGDLTGIILGVRICNGKGLMCRMSARVIVWGGPVVKDDDSEIAAVLLKEFAEKVKNSCVYCEVRNIYPPGEEFVQAFAHAGFSYKPHLNVIVDIRDKENILFKKLASAKRRNVKKAIKKGLVFDEVRNSIELKEAYNILKEVYDRTEVPLSDFSLFKAMYELLVPSGLCRIFKVTRGDEMIGMLAALVFNGRMYEWYVGSKKEFYNMRPNEFIVWEAFRYAKKEGLSYFDFGGAGKPGKKYGVRDFKKGFGGEIVETGRFRIVNKRLPWLMGNMAVGMKKLFTAK